MNAKSRRQAVTWVLAAIVLGVAAAVVFVSIKGDRPREGDSSGATLAQGKNPNSESGVARTPPKLSLDALLVPQSQLSSQDTAPFRFLGKAVTADHPRWKDYSRAISGYPTTQSCLSNADRIADPANMLDFNWQELDDFEEIEVCLLRVFASLGETPKIEAWLRAFGFETRGLRPSGVSDPMKKHVMHAIWSADQLYETSGIDKFLPGLTWRGLPRARLYVVSIQFDSEMKLSGVSIHAEIE